MKKFVIAVMAVFAMTFAACGNGQTSSSTSSNDSDTVAVDSADTIKADTTAVIQVAQHSLNAFGKLRSPQGKGINRRFHKLI